MITELITEKDLHQSVRRSVEEISKICSSDVTITSSGYHKDPVQTLLMRRKSFQDGIFLPIIESSAIDAEKMAAGAGETFLRIFSHSMIEDLGRKIIGSNFDNEWVQILEKIDNFSIPARKSDLLKVISFKEEGVFNRIFKSIFDNVRAGDKILIKKGPQSETAVSRESGYCFEGLGVDPRFLFKGNWTRKNVRTFLIDGIIESVSEIHRLLEELSKNKTPSIIFCVDALPDVYETLVKNYQMGNLDTILIKIPVTEFHINTMVDLGVILGLEPVSAGTGETISTGVCRQESFAERITITRSKISIEDSKRINQVQIHLADIRKRINDDINLFPILEGRVNSLSSSTVQATVGIIDQKMDPRIIEKLDRAFRSLPKLLKLGFIEKNDFKEFSRDKIDLLFQKNNEISAEMARQSIKIFVSARDTIFSAAIGIKKI